MLIPEFQLITNYLAQRRFIQEITQKLPNNVGVSLYKATQYKTQVTRVT